MPVTGVAKVNCRPVTHLDPMSAHVYTSTLFDVPSRNRCSRGDQRNTLPDINRALTGFCCLPYGLMIWQCSRMFADRPTCRLRVIQLFRVSLYPTPVGLAFRAKGARASDSRLRASRTVLKAGCPTYPSPPWRVSSRLPVLSSTLVPGVSETCR